MLVLVVGRERELPPTEVIGLARLAAGAKKRAVLASVDPEGGGVTYVTISEDLHQARSKG